MKESLSPKCETEFLEGAKYCQKCGANLGDPQQIIKEKKNLQCQLLLIFIIITFVCVQVQFLINELIDNWYNSPLRYIYGAFMILHHISIILPALVIKNKTLKIIGIIFAAIVILYRLYSFVEFLVR